MKAMSELVGTLLFAARPPQARNQARFTGSRSMPGCASPSCAGRNGATWISTAAR